MGNIFRDTWLKWQLGQMACNSLGILPKQGTWHRKGLMYSCLFHSSSVSPLISYSIRHPSYTSAVTHSKYFFQIQYCQGQGTFFKSGNIGVHAFPSSHRHTKWTAAYGTILTERNQETSWATSIHGQWENNPQWNEYERLRHNFAHLRLQPQ